MIGSEDGFVYMYDKLSGEVQQKIQTGSKVVHLVKPFPGGNNFEYAQTGLDEGGNINIWGVKSQSKLQPTKIK